MTLLSYVTLWLAITSGTTFVVHPGELFNKIECSRSEDGSFTTYSPHPTRCEAYQICDQNGLGTYFYCPPRRLWNQQLLRCDKPENVECTSEINNWNGNYYQDNGVIRYGFLAILIFGVLYKSVYYLIGLLRKRKTGLKFKVDLKL